MYTNILDKLNEAMDEGFTHSVKVDLSVDQPDKDAWFDYDLIDDQVRLDFEFEQEQRSWGIKGIEFNLRTPSITLAYEIHTGEEGDDREEKSVVVKKEDIQIEWVPGHAYTVGDLEVYLNQDGSLREATLEVYYLQK